MKNLYLIIILLSVLTIVSCSSIIRNKLTKKNFTNVSSLATNIEEDFYWVNDTVAGNYNEKIALYLPVKLNIFNEIVLFQLDLGAANSEIYLKSACALNSTYKDSLNHLNRVFFQISNSKAQINRISVNNSMGSNQRVTNKLKLGNLGYDFFINKILVLDYKNGKFLITDDLPQRYYNDFTVVPFASINKFPIVVRSKVNGHKSKLMFDTGSSAFEFMTYPTKFKKLQGNSIESEKCCIQAFGKKYTLTEAVTNNTLEVFNKKFNQVKISTTSKFNADKQSIIGMKLLGIDGITGNKYVLENVLILNFKENRMWIK